MIRLASIIETFEADLLQQGKLLPGQLHALNAIKNCRSEMSPKMRGMRGLRASNLRAALMELLAIPLGYQKTLAK